MMQTASWKKDTKEGACRTCTGNLCTQMPEKQTARTTTGGQLRAALMRLFSSRSQRTTNRTSEKIAFPAACPSTFYFFSN